MELLAVVSLEEELELLVVVSLEEEEEEDVSSVRESLVLGWRNCRYPGGGRQGQIDIKRVPLQ